MQICLICVTHEKTPQKYLDKIYQYYRNNEQNTNEILSKGVKEGAYAEFVLIPTCHRFELYALANDPEKAFAFFQSLILKAMKIKAEGFIEKYVSFDAMAHLSLVAAGAKSKIIGEIDILHQVKKAYVEAKPHCAGGRALSEMFSASLRIALKWRNRSSIQQGYLSYADIPLKLISEKTPDFGKNFMVFGTGMMGTYLIRMLKLHGAKKIYVCSRDFENAKSLAVLYGAEPVSLDDTHNIFSKIDIFLFCMAGGPFVDLHKLLPKIKLKTLIFDMGVPPNTPKGMEKILGAEIYTLADFSKFIEADSINKEHALKWVKEAVLKDAAELYSAIAENLANAPDIPKKDASLSSLPLEEEKIRAYVLENSVKFGGKPRADSVINKLFQEGMAKDQIRAIAPKVKSLIEEISIMPLPHQEAEFALVKGKVASAQEQKPQKKDLPELPNVKGKVVTRIAPEPSKYNHIGHALVFLIQSFYAQKYNGECILRMEDTNPEKSTVEYYNAMMEDLKWVGIKWGRQLIVSDDMPLFLDYAVKLITWKDAYTCSCSGEDIKQMRADERACPCRNKDVPQNLHEWNGMLAGKYPAGKMTLRLKGDMGDQNATMRDPIIFRLFDTPHFKEGMKYRAWPMYDFENPIEDSLCGITHVIRTKEFELREDLHKYLLFLLSMKGPTVKEISRYNIEGAVTQGREIRRLIEDKVYSGWDDPRLVTIKALRRRGFAPEMFQELARTVGLSKSAGKIDFSVLEAINKKIIDPIANRYFFVENPKRIKISGAPKMRAELDLHPDFIERGKRVFETDNEFYITDEILQGETYRFIHLFNFKDGKFLSAEHDSSLNAKLIHWLPANENNVNAEIMMPDATLKHGLAEKGVKNLKEGDVIQFERFGFCRFDRKEAGKYAFWLTHK